MVDRLIQFMLRQRLLVIIATVVVALGGVVAWKHLPIDAFPDVTNVQAMILTEAPGLAPVDVEQRVTFPIEIAMQGLPKVQHVRSLSKSGLSQVVVVFEDDVDIYFARQLVLERLQSAKEELPESVKPELGPISTGLGEIYQYTVESGERTLTELRTIQDWLIAPQLRAVPGVNEINSFGGFVKQYHILVNPENLLKHGLTLNEVVESVERNNAGAGGNFIQYGWEQAYVRSMGMIQDIKDIEHIVLTAREGTPLYLKDIADIEIGHQTRQGAITRDGKGESVAGMVIMLRGENSKLVVDRVKKAIPQVQTSLPKDVKISTFYDRTALIQACVKTVRDALFQGGVFVIIVLFLLLWNIRAGLLVALSLPLTVSITFVFMGWRGVTANLMSLGGLAIAIGMVCDGSIVIAENIMRHLSQRESTSVDRLIIVREAVSEVVRPVVFSILIIVIVFLPLFTLEQMEGKMFKPLATTMCFAIVGALIVALTIVPVLGSLVLRGQREGRDPAILRLMKRIYLRALDMVLRHPKTTLAVAAAVLIGAVLIFLRVGTEFLPKLDEGAIAINVVRLPSASLEGSVAVGTFMEQRLLKFQEVRTVVTKTGRAEISEDPMGPELSDVFVMLHPRKEWTTGRSKDQLARDIQKELSTVPGIRLSFSQPIALRVNELISGIKSDLAIKLFGTDLDKMKEYANQIAVVLQGIEGAEDVRVEQMSGFAQVEITVDRRAIARHKINVADINNIVETAVGGKVATTVIEGQTRFAVLVRFPEKDRCDIEAMKRILVRAPDGTAVPLRQLAQIREVEAPAQISRENGARRVVVECNIRGRDMGSFVEETQTKLAGIRASLTAGYYLRYGGQFENQERAMRRLSVVVPISISLIFLMLYSAFGSLPSALLVLVNLPFSLVGGVLVIWALDIPLSVSAIIGFIALFGVAVENGTVLVSFFNDLSRRGMEGRELVRTACELRFRPLMMTTLTTLLGIIPMAIATGSGAELQRPIALVVLGGLVFAQGLTLLVLPALYFLVGKRIVNRNKTA